MALIRIRLVVNQRQKALHLKRLALVLTTSQLEMLQFLTLLKVPSNKTANLKSHLHISKLRWQTRLVRLQLRSKRCLHDIKLKEQKQVV